MLKKLKTWNKFSEGYSVPSQTSNKEFFEKNNVWLCAEYAFLFWNDSRNIEKGTSYLSSLSEVIFKKTVWISGVFKEEYAQRRII